MGDASTKFFHVNATIKFRKNLITCLENDVGVPVFDHQLKVDLIWHSYKERLGISDFSAIIFNLDSIVQPVVDLSDLIEPFTSQEIDAVVRSLPSDKAPRPDGFNTDFVKKSVGQ